MISASAILGLSGIACLVVSGLMMRKLTPREDRPAPGWMKTDLGQTVMAMSLFILMIAGVALLAKAIF